MRVRYDEGVAIHVGPEPCASAREGMREASVGERIGQPLSRERNTPRGADALLSSGRQHGLERYREPRTTRRGQRPWHVRKLLAREPGGPRSGRHGGVVLVRIGKARSHSR